MFLKKTTNKQKFNEFQEILFSIIIVTLVIIKEGKYRKNFIEIF